MGGVVHRGQAGPVAGPAVHVLLVAGLQELDFAEFAATIELLHEEKLPRVNHRFHHHVFQAGLARELHDLLAVLDGGGHRHGAGDVFAGAQGLDGLRGVIGDGRVDVHGLDLRIGEQLVVVLITFFDSEVVGDFVELLAVALADGDETGVRMRLINGDELCAEAEPDDGDVDLAVAHRD